MRWKPDSQNPWSDHADHGGDRQVSEVAYSVRYIGEPVAVTGQAVIRLSPSYAEGAPLHPVVTICWYVVDDERQPGRFIAESDTEYDLVTDPNRPPGDTEVWSDSRYDSHGLYDLLAAAVNRCEVLARGHSEHDIGWDGHRLPVEDGDVQHWKEKRT